jgi:hypothetical protein
MAVLSDGLYSFHFDPESHRLGLGIRGIFAPLTRPVPEPDAPGPSDRLGAGIADMSPGSVNDSARGMMAQLAERATTSPAC